MLRFSRAVPLGVALFAAGVGPVVLAQQPTLNTAPAAPIGGPTGGAGGGPAAAPAGPRPEIISFASREDKWAWLRKTGDEVELFYGVQGQPGKSITRGTGWTEVAIDERGIWLLKRDGRLGELYSVSAEGGTPIRMLGPLEAPGGLFALSGHVLWVETHTPVVPDLMFVPNVAGRNVLCSTEDGKNRREIGETQGGLEARPYDLHGIGESVYVQIHRVASTEFYFADARSTSFHRLAVEEGLQVGVLSHQGYFWTAPSEEAPTGAGLRCVRYVSSSGETKTVTDWLPGRGRLLRLGGQVVYAGDELYGIPMSLGEPVYKGELPLAALASDGRSVLEFTADGPRAVVPVMKK